MNNEKRSQPKNGFKGSDRDPRDIPPPMMVGDDASLFSDVRRIQPQASVEKLDDGTTPVPTVADYGDSEWAAKGFPDDGEVARDSTSVDSESETVEAQMVVVDEDATTEPYAYQSRTPNQPTARQGDSNREAQI